MVTVWKMKKHTIPHTFIFFICMYQQVYSNKTMRLFRKHFGDKCDGVEMKGAPVTLITVTL